MKNLLLLACALLTLACSQSQNSPETTTPAAARPGETPEQLVQRQLDAYNARDVAQFAATYAADVELLGFPAKLRSEGRQQLEASYKKFFDSAPQLHCDIVNRTILGNKVIDHERVTGMPDGQTLETVAVYEVENGLIRRVTFIR